MDLQLRPSMDETSPNLEVLYIRLRGWFWNILQLIAIFMIIVGAVRVFAPFLVYRADALSTSIRTVAEIIAPLPSIGGWVYLVGGLVGTLVISTVR